MKKLLTLAAACAAVLALLVPSASAITGNYQDDFVHDYVGLLVFYTEPNEQGDIFSHRCSGTLISPTVVVTAGHCTTGVDEGRIYWAQSAAPNYDPNAFGGLGGDPTTGYPYFDFGPADTSTFSRADNFGYLAGFPNTEDVGVVVLDSPYTPPSGQFGVLPSVGAIDTYAAGKKKQDVRFTSSGYGLSDQDPVPVSFRERLMATAYLVNNEAPITEFNLKTTANPSQGKGGTCNGDSGGPIFFEGTRVIAAVTSFGMNPQCKGLDFSYRLDRAEVLAWITNPNRPDAG
jgi:Trypsin